MYRLILGDCLDEMAQLADGSVDLVLTDLPYGCTDNGWDAVIPLDQLWEHWNRVCKPSAWVILTCRGRFTGDVIASNRRKFSHKLVWVKTRVTGFLNARRLPMGTRYPVDVVCFGRTADDDLSHPTQKPVEMSKYLVKQYSDPFGVVLDCTMGTGGLLIGALMEGRVAIGIEKDEAYFNLAEERFLRLINKMKELHTNNNRKKAA